MILRVRTSLRKALDKLPAPVVAVMINEGWLESWPLEITRKGRRMIKVVSL